MAAPQFPVGDARRLLSTDGEIVQLQHPHCAMALWLAFQVKTLPTGVIVLKNLSERGGGSLRILPVGSVDLKGGQGQWAQFNVVHHPDNTISLLNVGNGGKQNTEGQIGWHLGVNAAGQPDGRAGVSQGRWRVARVPDDVRPHLPAVQSPAVEAAVFMEDWELSREQILSFAENGFLHVPNVVEPHLIDRALIAINKKLGEPGALQRTEVGALTLGPDVTSHPDILNLMYASPAYTLAQRLVGRGKLNKPRGAQTALRFPEGGMPPLQDSGLHWHVDGLEKETHSSFTLLLGVTLSDCMTDYAGNFTAYAGSHHTVVSDMRDIVRAGLPPSTIVHSNKRAFGNARQVHARRGDIVMAHHKLAHRGGANHSANIRYQIYFRLTHVDHERLLDACLEDLFVEFDGVRQVLHGNGAASLPPSPAPTPAAAPSAPTHTPPTAGQAMPPHQFPHVAPTHTAGMTAPSAAMRQPVHAIQRTPQLEQLVAMGFSPEQSDTALHATGGDVAAATELLLAQT